MKRHLAMAESLLLTAALFCTPVLAEQTETVIKIDGSEISVMTDYDNGEVLLPVRAICEAIGAQVEWNGDSKVVRVSSDTVKLNIIINNNQLDVLETYSDGSSADTTVMLDTAPQIINESTYMSGESLADALSYSITTDENGAIVLEKIEANAGYTTGDGYVKITLLGAEYEGTFSGDITEGLPDGYGVFTASDRSIQIEGNWESGKISGEIKYTSTEGNTVSTYEGSYSDGSFEGHGVMTVTNTETGAVSVLEGNFTNGSLNGEGTYTSTEYGTFAGNWENGVRTGTGTFTYVTGAVYEGEWADNKYNGQGKYTYANGDVYEGSFVDGKAEGYGVLTCVDGSSYEGEWAGDEFNGKGKYTDVDGTVYDGTFEEGYFKG